MSGRPALLAGATLFELEPSEIETGDRIGFLHTDKAAALGRLMAVDGQRDPIKLVKNRKGAQRPWRLVTGMHRTHGAELEGIKVWAIEVSGKAEDLADLEASENLHRRPLGPIERAKFTAALVQAAQERIAREHGGVKQQQLAVKARWDRVKAGETRADDALTEEVGDTCAKIAHVYGWEESVGEALGMSKRSIYNDLQLFRLVVEPFSDLVTALANHPVVGENGAQLKAIASIKDEGCRRSVIEALLADHELSVDAARVQAGIDQPDGPTPPQHQKFIDQIEGGWSRLSLAYQREFVPKIPDMLTQEMKRQLRDLLNKSLGESASDQGKLVPAVAIRASVKPDYIVCLEDGTRHLRLRAHLGRLGMTPDEYLTRWQLPRDYPMTAPNEYERRRQHWTGVVRGWATRSKSDAR